MQSEKNLVLFDVDGLGMVDSWDKIGDRKLKGIKVNSGVMGNGGWVVLKGYEKYMFQKYGMYTVGLGRGDVEGIVALAGVQVGGYKNGMWVVVDMSLLERVVKVELKEGITSIAIKEGII